MSNKLNVKSSYCTVFSFSKMVSWLNLKNYNSNFKYCFLKDTQRVRKLNKNPGKKLLKSNKSIFFSRNCISGSFKLFLSSKIDFWPFLKLQKMEFGQKIFSWNWFIWFHEFFYLDFFKFSGPLYILEIGFTF